MIHLTQKHYIQLQLLIEQHQLILIVYRLLILLIAILILLWVNHGSIRIAILEKPLLLIHFNLMAIQKQ